MTAPIGALTVQFSADEMAAIDAWIERAPEPKPDRADAVRQLVAGRLGVGCGYSTVLPDFTTGRDIV